MLARQSPCWAWATRKRMGRGLCQMSWVLVSAPGSLALCLSPCGCKRAKLSMRLIK